MTSAGGGTKDPYHVYTTSFMTSAGGQTNHSPQSEGVARTTGGTKRRPLIDPLWVGLENQHLESDLPREEVVIQDIPLLPPWITCWKTTRGSAELMLDTPSLIVTLS